MSTFRAGGRGDQGAFAMSLKRPTGVVVTVLAFVAFVVGAVSPASAATSTSATDSFTRTVSNGLGTANTGGSWSLEGPSSRFSVSGGTPRLTMTAAAQLSGYLPATVIRDTDVVATVGLAALPKGGSFYLGVLARHAGSADYETDAIVSSTGAVALNVLATDRSLAYATVPGLTVAAGTGLRIRFQVTGATPTTIRARAVKVGTTEPTSWQVSTTDSTGSLQA